MEYWFKCGTSEKMSILKNLCKYIISEIKKAAGKRAQNSARKQKKKVVVF
jgi:hypothetical protein